MEEILVRDSPLVEEWLSDKRSANTRRTYEVRLRKFLTYHKMTPEEFIILPSKRQRNLAIRYQNELLDDGANPNTLHSALTTVASFLDYHDKPINWKRGQRVNPQIDRTSHGFSNGDLEKMFAIGNVKEKAMLALATSLGRGIHGILKLTRKQLRDHINRAKEEGKQFAYIRDIRQKTSVPRIGVLNPLALEWVDNWLTKSEDIRPMKRKHDREARINLVSDVFDMTGEGFNVMLQRLASKAQIKTTGRIRFHSLRKWVMSGLSRAGFNDFQTKYVMGKSILRSDMTYLQTLDQEIEERYPDAYEHYLNLKPTVSPKTVIDLSKKLEAKTGQIEALQAQLTRLQDQLTLVTEATQMLARDRNKLLHDDDVLALLEKKRSETM